MAREFKILSNQKSSENGIMLSIVSPFYGDNPKAWLENLFASKFANKCEIILVDDGNKDEALISELNSLIQSWPTKALIASIATNSGRSSARNLGIDLATGEYILFLDADMVPQNPDFLDRYFEIIEKKSAAIAFGGFISNTDIDCRETELHHNISTKGDSRPLAHRKALGAYSIASNNLLVKTRLAKIHRFDDEFKGWGWEDTEWALRAVSNGFGLVHIDNPAIHIGLDGNETLLRKYQEAGHNLALMLAKHPIANNFTAVKNAKIVGKLPFHKSLRAIARIIVRSETRFIPIQIRRYAIIFWRASWAAEAIGKTNRSK